MEDYLHSLERFWRQPGMKPLYLDRVVAVCRNYQTCDIRLSLRFGVCCSGRNNSVSLLAALFYGERALTARSARISALPVNELRSYHIEGPNNGVVSQVVLLVKGHE